MDELLVIGLAVSMIALAFSREKDEDEYTASVRSKYLTIAFYTDLIILIIATLAISSFGYLSFIAIRIFLVLLLYIIMFNIAIWRMRKLYKTSDDEK